MKYLVTGGCGFIGSNLVKQLLHEGHSVAVIDNLSSDAHDEFYYESKATYYKNNVVDYVLCSDIFKRHSFDAVFHLAAEASIQNCIQNPTLAIETNVMGTATILALCKNHNVKRLVLSSTSAIYGLKNSGLLDEDMASDCLNVYSLSKSQAEELCKLYTDMYNVDTVCLRYFNVYGERQPKRGPYAPIIGIFMRQLAANEALTVVGDGEQTRDYVHVDDVVRANIMAATHKTNLFGQVFNVGTGNSYSVNKIAKKLSSNIKYLPPRQGEVRHTKANISKIQNYFGWKPSIQLFEWLDTNVVY